MLRLGILLAIHILTATTALAGPGAIRTYTVAGWEISEYSNYCFASSRALKSGSTVLFFAVGEDGITALVTNKKWRMKAGRSATATVLVDGQALGTFPSKAFDEKMIEVTLPPAALKPLQVGDVVQFVFERGTVSFELNNSRTGLAAAVSCFLKKTNAVESREPPAAPDQKPAQSTGSGFFVDRLGHIVTNDHVVDGCTSLRVLSYGQATIVRRDPQNDLAVLKVNVPSTPAHALLRTGDVRHAEKILAFGYPFSDTLRGSLNVTTGIVSSLTGIDGDSRYIQISAPVQPGNSGGPLVDAEGNVAGVVSAKYSLRAAVALHGTVPENLAYAIRIEQVRQVLRIAGIEPDNAPPKGTALKDEDIAEAARSYTVLVHCAR